MPTTITAIAGFSGRLARHIASALLAKPDVVIHGIARSPAKVPQELALNPRVKIFEADASIGSVDKVRNAIRGTSIVICCYLGDDSGLIDGQKLLIDAAIAENVPRYMTSAFSFDFRGLKMNDIPAKNFQLIVDQYLAEKEAQGLIQGVQILNGAFIEIIFAPFFGVYNAEEKALNVWGSGDEKFEVTTLSDTARFVAEVATDPSAVGYMKIVSDSVSAKDTRTIYEEVYGHEIGLKKIGSSDDMMKTARAAQNAEPQQLFKWLGMLLQYYCINGSTYIRGDDTARYALRSSNLKDFFEATKAEDLPGLMMAR